MLSTRLHTTRLIPFLRPLRPPNPPPRPRLFTQKTQLLLVSRNTARPHLPYLSQPTFRSKSPITRLLSTETRAYLRDLSYQSTKWTAIIFIFFFLGSLVQTGLHMEGEERRKPTPGSWRWLTRQHLRSAREEARVLEEQRAPVVDWPKVGSHFKECLYRLEDEKCDGKGLVPAGGGEGISIEGVGGAGFDVGAKPWDWRAGYFEVLMGCATAAEHLDSMVLDQKRKQVFPREVVVGPSNPDPRPLPVYMDAPAPRDEDCVKFYEPPETYYMKILTTQGFGTRQKIDAAEGYANWLEFKGLHESAEEMYKWGVDIAKAALPNLDAPDEVMDFRSDVLKAEASTKATPNLLHSLTSLATHHARTGHSDLALPIFLSVLRARRSAPLAPFSLDADSGPPSPSTDVGAAVAMVKRWIVSPPFPSEPPTGDTPITRLSEKPSCEDGELMLYIGEILFAGASPAKDRARETEGVGWTRQGVLVAEANLQAKKDARADVGNGEKRCKECLLTGVRNWETMLRLLRERGVETTEREGGRDAGVLEWRGWFGGGGGGGGAKGRTLEEIGEGMLEQELMQVERLKERIVREGIEGELRKGMPRGGLWVG